MSLRSRSWLLLPVVAVLAAGLILGARGDLGWAALAEHQAMLQRLVAAAPLPAALLFCAVYVGCVVLVLPITALLTITGGLLFGVPAGFVLALGSASFGAVLLFLLARGAFAPLVARRAGPWLDRLRPRLQRDGFAYLLALRLIPVMPFWLLNLAPALVGMRVAPFAAATLLGAAPTSLILASIGGGLGGVLAAGVAPDLSVLRSPPVLLPIAGLVLLSLLPVAWRRLRRHA